MKKFFKVLIILLVVFIVLPVALLFIFVFDTGRMKVKYDDNFTTDEWVTNLVIDSLDHTKDEKAIKFIITEEDINNMIYSSFKDNEDLKQYMTQLAVDITNDHYIINVSGRVFFFETRARLHATLEKKVVVSGGSEEEAFVFTIDKVTLGRLTKLKEVVSFFLKMFLNNSTLDAMTESLKIHSDLEHSCVFIYASDMRQMLNDAFADNDGPADFYFAFINDFLDHNLLDFDFYGNEAFTISVNLDKLTGNDYDNGQYVCYDMKYSDTTTKLKINGTEKQLSLDTINEAIVSLLDNRLLYENEMQILSDYLFHGYDGSYRPPMDLSSIGIEQNQKETYPGFNITSKESIEDVFKEGVSSFKNYNLSLDKFEIAKISEKTINDFLKNQYALGMKFFLNREIEAGKNKVSYIALDNAYINLLKDGCVLTIGLNINGLETHITLLMDTDKTNTDTTKLVYKPKDIYFGKIADNLHLSSKSEDLIYDTLNGAIGSSAFKFSKDGTLTISFDSFINQAINMVNTGDSVYDSMYKTFLKDDAVYSIEVKGDKVEDNAEIVVLASRKN